MDTTTKPLQKLEKKDMVAQIANIKSANCFLQTNSPNITLANKYSCIRYAHTHWSAASPFIIIDSVLYSVVIQRSSS